MDDISTRVGFGILSWHGEASLAQALDSYARADLLSLFGETLLFLPDATPQGRALGRLHGLPTRETAQNLGICGGFKALAESMRSDILLLAENDYPLIEPRSEAQRQIEAAARSLLSGEAHVWRFRHRRQPGPGLQFHKRERYWPMPEAGSGARAIARLLRLLRPAKARSIAGWMALRRDDAERIVPGLVRRTAGGDWLVSSRALPWTNNVFMVRRRFFLETIIPAAEAATAGRLVNGFPTIETELNRGFWRRGDFWIGVGQGLFTHGRLDDRGY